MVGERSFFYGWWFGMVYLQLDQHMNNRNDAEKLMRKYNCVAWEIFHAIHKQVRILHVI